MRHNNLQILLYKLYIFCLPFGTLVNFEWLGYGTSFSTILMLLGSFLLVITGEFNVSRRVLPFIGLYAFMVFASLIMSSVLTVTLKGAFEESPFRSISGDIVLYGIFVCSIIYNWNSLTKFVNYRALYPIFTIQSIVLIVIGYIQLGVMLGIGPCLALYSPLSGILGIAEPKYLVFVNRGVTLFGTEPSSVAIVCFLTLPMLMGSLLENKGKSRIGYLILLLLLTLLLLLSGSTTVLACTLFVYILFLLANFGIRPGRIFMSLSFLLGLFIAMIYTSSDSHNFNIQEDSFAYKVIGKIVDRKNMSTAMRASTVINDMKIIPEYPITGVGNGNQGYFYNENIPNWVKASSEVQQRMSIAGGISNGGGNFFASYFSGFGLVGLIAFFLFLHYYIQDYKKSILVHDRRLDLTYRIGITLFLATAWISIGLKSNEIMCFLLVLPCLEFFIEPNLST